MNAEFRMVVGARGARVFFSLALLAWGGLELEAKQRVAVKAQATSDYLESREEEPDRIERYVVSKGRFFGGGVQDASMTEASFPDVVENLGRDLAQRGYLPADSLEGADLLIVVHWGTTFVMDDAENDDLIADAMSADPTADEFNGSADLRFAGLMDETNALSRAAQIRRNARLLGFEEDLRREERELRPTERERTLRTWLDQDRYFVILMAWDNRALQESKERRLLWSTRMSARAAGTNFREAMPLLSIAAKDMFGTVSEGLSSKTFRRGEYKAEMGEIEVVELSEEDRTIAEQAEAGE